MGLPSLKRIKRDLDVDGVEATVIRQAMEWAEGYDGSPKPTLESYWEEEVYPGPGHNRYASLDYYDDSRDGRFFIALEIIDYALDNYGVEYIPSREDTFRRVYGLEYSNTGDTYGTTVIYDRGEDKWYIGNWGSFVEYDEERFGE